MTTISKDIEERRSKLESEYETVTIEITIEYYPAQLNDIEELVDAVSDGALYSHESTVQIISCSKKEEEG